MRFGDFRPDDADIFIRANARLAVAACRYAYRCVLERLGSACLRRSARIDTKFDPGGKLEVNPKVGKGVGDFIEFAPTTDLYK